MSVSASKCPPLIERIIADEKKVSFATADSYLVSYVEFLRFFQERVTIGRHDLIVGAHFTYGWMPTILECGHQDYEGMTQILNLAKAGEELEVDQFEHLKSFVNGSIIGASKLLHFVNPSRYAILDSRADRYWCSGKSRDYYQMNTVKQYRAYLAACREAVADPRFGLVNESMNRKIGYSVTGLRAVELVMYTNGSKTQWASAKPI